MMILKKRSSDAVVVTTTLPLTKDEKEKVSNYLEKIFNKKFLHIENRIDKKVLGGIQIQIGDVLIDATVKGELHRLKNELLA